MAVAPKNKTRLANLVKGAKSVASKVVSGVKSTVGNVISGFGAAASKLPSTINTAGSVVSLQKTPQTSRGLNSSNARSQQLLVQSKFQNIQNKGISQSRTQVTPPRTISGSGVSRSGAPSTSTNDAYNTEFGGNPTYSPPSNLNISTGTTSAGTTSAIMPNAPVGTNYQGQILGKQIGLGADPTTGLIQAPTSEEETDTTNKDIFDSYIKALKQPESREKLYNEARQESGIDEARQRVNNTQAQINARTAQMQADILSEEGQGRGIPLDVLDTRRAEISRRAAIDLLPMQAQLAADQGNLEMAEETMNNLFDIYSTDAQNRVEFHNKNVEALYNFLTEEEKRKAEKVNKELDRKRKLLDDELAFDKQLALKAYDDKNYRLANAILKNPTPTNVSAPDYETELQRRSDRRSDYLSKYGVVADAGGDTSPLYSGLNSATAVAVRGVVNGFKTEPVVTNFTQVQSGYNFTKTLSDTTTNPADDQALIYSLAKVLDPGSVVREGEYATAQKYSQSWAKAYGKGVTQAIAGTGFLSQQARQNIKDTIESKYKSAKTDYQSLANSYANQINSLTGRDNGSEFLRDYITPDNTPEPPGNELPLDEAYQAYLDTIGKKKSGFVSPGSQFGISFLK